MFLLSIRADMLIWKNILKHNGYESLFEPCSFHDPFVLFLTQPCYQCYHGPTERDGRQQEDSLHWLFVYRSFLMLENQDDKDNCCACQEDSQILHTLHSFAEDALQASSHLFPINYYRHLLLIHSVWCSILFLKSLVHRTLCSIQFSIALLNSFLDASTHCALFLLLTFCSLTLAYPLDLFLRMIICHHHLLPYTIHPSRRHQHLCVFLLLLW